MYEIYEDHIYVHLYLLCFQYNSFQQYQIIETLHPYPNPYQFADKVISVPGASKLILIFDQQTNIFFQTTVKIYLQGDCNGDIWGSYIMNFPGVTLPSLVIEGSIFCISFDTKLNDNPKPVYGYKLYIYPVMGFAGRACSD
jgi:hypothetical protein